MRSRAVALARRLDHLYSQTLALAYAALLHQMRRDADRVLDCAEAVVALCERYGFAYYGDWAQVLIGWARGQERPAEGVATIESALERLDAKRAQARRPVLPVVARRDATASPEARIVRRRFWMRPSAMALERGDVWWLPALYLQKSELEPMPARQATLRRASSWRAFRANRGLEQRILGGTLSRTLPERSPS